MVLFFSYKTHVLTSLLVLLLAFSAFSKNENIDIIIAPSLPLVKYDHQCEIEDDYDLQNTKFVAAGFNVLLGVRIKGHHLIGINGGLNSKKKQTDTTDSYYGESEYVDFLLAGFGANYYFCHNFLKVFYPKLGFSVGYFKSVEEHYRSVYRDTYETTKYNFIPKARMDIGGKRLKFSHEFSVFLKSGKTRLSNSIGFLVSI